MTAKFMSLFCCCLWKPDHNDSMSEKNLTTYMHIVLFREYEINVLKVQTVVLAQKVQEK